MRSRLTFVAPLLVAGAAVVAVTAAPIAAQLPRRLRLTLPAQQSCATSGPGTVCQSPGNVQINSRTAARQLLSLWRRSLAA